MASRMCTHRLDLCPGNIPPRGPAVDRSWQGVPPERMSTGATRDQSARVISPWFGTPGQWWARTRAGASSFSATHTVSAPNTCSTARARPPYPAHSSPERMAYPTGRLRMAATCSSVAPVVSAMA
jgi:hypothetical protein